MSDKAMSDKTGGPAFPHEYKYGDGTAHRHEGMTLRDYFAAKAMQAALTAVGSWAACEFMKDIDTEILAAFSYKQADAMLKERDK